MSVKPISAGQATEGVPCASPADGRVEGQGVMKLNHAIPILTRAPIETAGARGEKLNARQGGANCPWRFMPPLHTRPWVTASGASIYFARDIE